MEEKRAATQRAIAKAAPEKTKATVVTACRDERRPHSPLMAAPASGKIGISQRFRFGVIA